MVEVLVGAVTLPAVFAVAAKLQRDAAVRARVRRRLSQIALAKLPAAGAAKA